MSATRLNEIIKNVKQIADCRELFRVEFPDHFRPSGNSLCPWHDDEKTLSLSIRKEAAYCHGGCAAKGKPEAYDAINIVQKAAGIGFQDAVRQLAARYSIYVATNRQALSGRSQRPIVTPTKTATFCIR